MMQEILARKLRVLRAERGITLQEAEELTGVTRETLGALEHGQRGAYTNTLQKIAEGYGTTVEDLVKEGLAVPLAEASETGRPASPGLEDWLLERCGHALLTLSDQELEEAFEKAHDEDPEAVKALFQGITDELLAVLRPADVSREEEMLLRSRRGAATLQWAKAFTESGLYANADEEFQKSVKAIAEALQAA